MWTWEKPSVALLLHRVRPQETVQASGGKSPYNTFPLARGLSTAKGLSFYPEAPVLLGAVILRRGSCLTPSMSLAPIGESAEQLSGQIWQWALPAGPGGVPRPGGGNLKNTTSSRGLRCLRARNKPRGQGPGAALGRSPLDFFQEEKQNKMHRLHVGLHDVQKGPGFGGPLRKARAWALNQEGESRVGRHREHPGQPVSLEGTVAPEKFFSALPRTPALGRGGQACSPASPPTPAREETGRASAGGSRALLRHQGGEAAGSRAPGPSGATPSRHFPLKRFGEKRGGLGSIGGAKGSPHGKRKISKIALVVQPKVNSSISPAADRSNGQETTAENKAPRCSAGANPARPH